MSVIADFALVNGFCTAGNETILLLLSNIRHRRPLPPPATAKLPVKWRISESPWTHTGDGAVYSSAADLDEMGQNYRTVVLVVPR